MQIRDLINEILDEIGQLVGGRPASDTDAARCCRLINKCVREYNVQGFLHFTHRKVELGQGKEFTFDTDAPLTVNAVYYKSGPSYYKLDPVQDYNILAYEGVQRVPAKFCYRKEVDDGAVVGILSLDCESQYDITAFVTNDMKAYDENDVFSLPPEFENLLIADVQYRWISNLAISDELKRDKRMERDRLLQYIKEIETSTLDVPQTVATTEAKFFGGVGRLPW